MSYYLGLDSSTQGLKAEVIDTAAGKVVGSFAVNAESPIPADLVKEIAKAVNAFNAFAFDC